MKPPAPTLPQNPNNSVAIAFGVKFVVLAALGVVIISIPAVDKAVISPFNDVLAAISDFLVSPFRNDVSAVGRVLQFADGRGGVAVAGGCNGVEVCLLITAAMLAFPTKLSLRLWGVLICILAIQSINILRIVSLLFLSRYAVHLFDFFHTYVWDAVILLDAVLIFFLWLRSTGKARTA